MLTTSPTVTGRVTGMSARRRPCPACRLSAILLEEVVHLSEKTDAAGRLNWDVPAGAWKILRFGYTPTGARNVWGLFTDCLSAEALVDWTMRPEDGIKYYSGTAVYRKKFNISVVPTAGQKLLIDLGEVHEQAVVKLNSTDLGVVWTKPARVDISAAAHPGENILKITVVNLWPNRLIGDAALPLEKCFTETNIRNPVWRLVFNGLHQQMTAITGKLQGHFSSVPHSAAPSGKQGVRWCQKSRSQGQISPRRDRFLKFPRFATCTVHRNTQHSKHDPSIRHSVGWAACLPHPPAFPPAPRRAVHQAYHP